MHTEMILISVQSSKCVRLCEQPHFSLIAIAVLSVFMDVHRLLWGLVEYRYRGCNSGISFGVLG